jgi:ACS family glucarate transporter-like MFS transporter
VASHPPGRSSIRWYILALLFAASFVAYLLRTNMSITGTAMMTDLGLSLGQLGWIMAANAWAYAIFQFPGGVFGNRIGARRCITIAAVLWGVFTLLIGFTPSADAASPAVILGWLIVVRALLGASVAPLYPVTGGAMTCAWFPVTGWAFPNSVGNAGLTFGSAAAGPFIAWLMETYGWRQSFIYTAPIAFLLAGAWWWYARDTPAEHPNVREDELALIDDGRPEFARVVPAPGAWKVVLRDKDVLLLAVSYFCSNYVFYFFLTWLFIYLVNERGFAILESGIYSAVPWMTGAVGALVGGVFCDGLSKRMGLSLGCRIPAMAGLLLAGGCIFAAATAVHPLAAVALLSLCLAFQQMAEGAFWAATIAVSGRYSSSACGVLNTGGNAVGGVVALLVPATVAYAGWPAALAGAAAMAAAGALLWLAIGAGKRFTTPQREGTGAVTPSPESS